MAKILVVDDDPVMRMTIGRLLEQGSHTVISAGDGQNAVGQVRSERSDLVILDILMPGMDGLEAMRLILNYRPDVPILMTSARPNAQNSISEPDYHTMATKPGPVSALPKPFKPATLSAKVAECLASAASTSAPPRPGP